ncbi:MAG: efflux RND transporter periplasmic adaptor subunit [Magnetococcales bacterium]|nr:efflux RND transporter periplasmic adaptor subunit [Magnetococcales bacterium]
MTEAASDSGRPPPLREELHLFPGPHLPDGSPTWTLRDPATNQFFRIGWQEFEILIRWRRGAPSRIAELVTNETTLVTTAEDVSELVRFLLGANLLRPQGERGLTRLTSQVQSAKHSWLHHLLHAYLFFRIPLLNPEFFLRRTLPWMQWAFSQKFILATAIAGIFGLSFIVRQWDVAMTTFRETDSITEVMFISLAMFLTKAIHELGHAYTATRYGCRVPTIGVAFLMLMPVLYTDTSEVWKLASRRRRLIIAAGGILSELMLTAWASLIWGLLPLGGFKDALFFIATVSWISTIIMNASPFLRFDGYYLFSDWLGIENLHDRAGRLGRWKLRELLLGLQVPIPEPALNNRKQFLIAFAWLTWVYRLFLYFGIAIAVYHLFFKLLGMILMGVEIGWFLIRPVWSEIGIWLRPETHLQWNASVLRSLIVLAGLIALLLVPWKSSLKAPAIWQREERVTLYAPVPARIDSLEITAGSTVEKGQQLLRLSAPDLMNKLKVARIKIETSLWKRELQGSHHTLLRQSPMNDRQLDIDQAQYDELQRQRRQLTVVAPMAGWVAFLGKEIKPGVWVTATEPLLDLAHPSKWQGIAYVREIDLNQITLETHGTFLPEGMDWDPVPCHITSIAVVAATTLDEPLLSTQYGGVLPTHRDEKGRWLPTTAIYRVTVQPTVPFNPPDHVLRGSVVLESRSSKSVLAQLYRAGAELVIRETGF